MTRYGPTGIPIGLFVSGVARDINRAFDAELSNVGGAAPVWPILLSLSRTKGVSRQRDLAHDVGLSEGTLTHHLSAFEREGLVARRRADDNRRVQIVELTAKGRERFELFATASEAFDARLRDGLTEEEVSQLAELLGRMRANVTDTNAAPVSPWAGQIKSTRG